MAHGPKVFSHCSQGFVISFVHPYVSLSRHKHYLLTTERSEMVPFFRVVWEVGGFLCFLTLRHVTTQNFPENWFSFHHLVLNFFFDILLLNFMSKEWWDGGISLQLIVCLCFQTTCDSNLEFILMSPMNMKL